MSKIKSHILSIDDGKIYKLLDLFLDDDQKDSLLINVVITIGVYAANIPFIRRFVDENNEFQNMRAIKTKVDDHIFVVAIDTDKKNIECFYRPKGFLSEWKDVSVGAISKDLEQNILASKSKKDIKRCLGKLLKLKAFW
jgi:hypothetical protein